MRIGNKIFCNTCGADITNTATRKDQKYCRSSICQRVQYDVRVRRKKTNSKYHKLLEIGNQIAEIRLKNYEDLRK